MNRKTNVERPEHFTQVCVWENCEIGKGSIQDFEDQIAQTFKDVRVKFLEEIITLPGHNGKGGRTDLFFCVHEDDIGKFAVPRLMAGIRWIEDVIDNADRRYGCLIHPERIREYRTW